MDNAIKRIRKDYNLTQDELAGKLGVTRELVNKMESGKVSISHKNLFKIQELFPEIVNKNSQSESKKPANAGADSKDVALINLSESNRLMAEAHLKIAESNKTMAENNRELITVVKVSLNGAVENPLTVASTLRGILEAIAEVGTGKNWRTKSESLAAVHRLVYGNVPDKRKGSSAAGAGK